MIRLVLYLAQCGFRLWKLTIALTFRCVSSLISVSRNSSTATAQQSNDTDTIAKLDLIEALDSEIAVLAQEKQFYEQQLNANANANANKPSTEKQLRAQHKVAQLNTRMMVLTRRVLKLREELENGKTSI